MIVSSAIVRGRGPRLRSRHVETVQMISFCGDMSQDRLDASLDIDRRSSRDIVRIIQAEDARIAAAVAAEGDRIALAVDQITERLASGGRLFYAGAGTSEGSMP